MNVCIAYPCVLKLSRFQLQDKAETLLFKTTCPLLNYSNNGTNVIN